MLQSLWLVYSKKLKLWHEFWLVKLRNQKIADVINVLIGQAVLKFTPDQHSYQTSNNT
jgi:hypothetical protein